MSNRTAKTGSAVSTRQAAAFKAKREAAGYSQEAVAATFGISHTTVCGWEKGKWLPRLETIVRIAELYGCKVDDLLDPHA